MLPNNQVGIVKRKIIKKAEALPAITVASIIKLRVQVI